MKKKSLINRYVYLLQGFTFLMLCLNAHHSYAQEQNAQQLPTLSEMQNIDCRIEGEMNPYVGEVYQYTLLQKEKAPIPNYVLQIFDGTKWEQHKVIVNR